MRPWIQDGDLIEIRPAAPPEIGRGDVVLGYTTDHRMVVHRVIGACREGGRTLLHTRGDALTCADVPLAPEQILGRVVGLERGGRQIRIDSGLWPALGRLWVALAPLGHRLLRMRQALIAQIRACLETARSGGHPSR